MTVELPGGILMFCGSTVVGSSSPRGCTLVPNVVTNWAERVATTVVGLLVKCGDDGDLAVAPLATRSQEWVGVCVRSAVVATSNRPVFSVAVRMWTSVVEQVDEQRALGHQTVQSDQLSQSDKAESDARKEVKLDSLASKMSLRHNVQGVHIEVEE